MTKNVYNIDVIHVLHLQRVAHSIDSRLIYNYVYQGPLKNNDDIITVLPFLICHLAGVSEKVAVFEH